MKNIYSILAGLLLTASVFAQAPQKMSYQAVIRNSGNALVTSTPVGMRISIIQGSLFGSSVYVETQTATTNANGLVSIEIGSGTPIVGSMAGINWATGPYFIKTESDPSGGTNYTISGTSELMSVPYALFSSNGTPGPIGLTGATGATGPQGIQGPQGPAGSYTAGLGISISGGTISNTAPNQIVNINGSGGTNVTGTYPNLTVSTPRITAGTSTGGFAPTVITGSGFTVTRLNTGLYSVVFSTSFLVAPTVVASVYNTNATYMNENQSIKISNITTTDFLLRTFIYQNSNVLWDSTPFSFIAIGN